jgi:hypothetical protein
MTSPYPNMKKPPREPGMSCPLMGGKDVSKVCHKCDFYQVIQGKLKVKANPDDTGAWIDHWACTLAHSHMFQANTAANVDAQTVELNILRNDLAKQNAQQSMLLARVGQVIEMLMQQVAIGNHQRQKVIEKQDIAHPDMIDFARSQ